MSQATQEMPGEGCTDKEDDPKGKRAAAPAFTKIGDEAYRLFSHQSQG